MSSFANIMRPKSVEDVIGQTHIKDLLNRIIQNRQRVSILFYGKPGIGKTSLAYALCNDLKVNYSYFNASTGNKAELTELIKINDYLIIDEIHRLNKDKQDILLPAIEFGKISIIATTTENPFFVVNPAVRSRVHILELKLLTDEEQVEGILKIIKNNDLKIKISKDLLLEIVRNSNGDYRYSLNILDLLVKLYDSEKITKKIIKSLIPTIHFYSDRNGDGHFDLLSAFHKSLRGSDVDASLYYLAKLITSGDLLGLERRMLAVAYEDIGLANPNLALRVNTALDVSKKIGFPEARLPLANAVIELAKSPKSNSAYLAIDNALESIASSSYDIPKHLKDSHYKSAKKLGNGVDYKYPHDYGGYVEQQYLPDEIKDNKFFKRNKNDKI